MINIDNLYSIKIHDTPSRAMPKRIDRAFSHGCIRVQDPIRPDALLL